MFTCQHKQTTTRHQHERKHLQHEQIVVSAPVKSLITYPLIPNHEYVKQNWHNNVPPPHRNRCGEPTETKCAMYLLFVHVHIIHVCAMCRHILTYIPMYACMCVGRYVRTVCMHMLVYVHNYICLRGCMQVCMRVHVCLYADYVYFWLPLGASASAVPGRSYRFNFYTSPLTKLDQFKPKIDLIERGPNEY